MIAPAQKKEKEKKQRKRKELTCSQPVDKETKRSPTEMERSIVTVTSGQFFKSIYTFTETERLSWDQT